MRLRKMSIAAGFLFLFMSACSLSLLPLPTPFPTIPLGASLTPHSPTAPAASPTPALSAATSTQAAPTSTSAASTPVPPTATSASVTLAPTPVPPSPTPGTLSGPYGVIQVGASDVLNIRSSPGAENAAVGTFAYNTANVMRTGPTATAGGELWDQVQNPSGGTGWVSSRYLTEYVPHAAFCADSRVNTLIANLNHALTTNDGAQLASLVSPAHGMEVRLYRNGKSVNYDATHAQYVFTSTFTVDWGPAPGSGQETEGSFHVSVLPGLQEVFNASYTLSCDSVQTGGASYDTSWPAQFANIRFYSVYKPGPSGDELNWRTVLVGVEYVNAQPYVFSLTQLFWEP